MRCAVLTTTTLACAGLLISALIGCGASDFARSFTMPEPLGRGVNISADTLPNVRRSVVLVGNFDDPGHVDPRFAGIGAQISRLLQRTLSADRRFDARLDPTAGQRVKVLLNRTTGEPPVTYEDLLRQYPNADYVITGRVSDFHHTADLSPTVSRRKLFGGRRNDAVAVIDVHVVDVRAQRVAVTEEFIGVVTAGSEPTDEVYRGVPPDAYLFRKTPLGVASQAAVDDLVARMEARTPLAPVELRIVERDGRRRVTIAGGRDHGVSDGQIYYVYAPRHDAVGALPVYDPALGEPLSVRIDRVSNHSSTAWLLGEPPANVDLSRAVLSRRRPADDNAASPSPAASDTVTMGESPE